MAKGKTSAQAFEVTGIKPSKAPAKLTRKVTSYMIDVDLQAPIRKYSIDKNKSISDIINEHFRSLLEKDGYI